MGMGNAREIGIGKKKPLDSMRESRGKGYREARASVSWVASETP